MCSSDLADMSKLPKETQKYIRGIKAGGVVAFKNKGQVDEEEDPNDLDISPWWLAAPDALRFGSQLVRGAPALPPGTFSGLGTAGARTLGSMANVATTAGVPSTIGLGGYKLSKDAARTLARPEAKEFRKGLIDTATPTVGGASGDTEPEQEMHDINKPITLDDLTNPNK